jgi:hypothetical protein
MNLPQRGKTNWMIDVENDRNANLKTKTTTVQCASGATARLGQHKKPECNSKP